MTCDSSRLALARLLHRLDGVKECGDGYQALCPGHDDHEPSLSITEGDGGRILLHCHAGCDIEDILAPLDLEMKDLFARRSGHRALHRKSVGRLVATYDYQDEKGNTLYQILRYSPKSFSVRRPNGNGGWIPNIKGVRLVPYRLPDLLDKKFAYVTEGEEDADNLKKKGFAATTNPFGAGKWEPEFNSYFEGKCVRIIPDNDEPGEKHARDVAHNLLPIAEEVKIVHLPDLPPKGDVSDFIAAGGTGKELVQLAQSAKALTAADLPPAESTQKTCDNLQGREILFAETETWPEAVDGAQVLSALAAVFKRYLVLPAGAPALLALWVLHTYALDASDITPVLAITSPEMRCGKTLLQELLSLLVRRALVASNITPAALFRVVERFSPSLLIDELDSFVQQDEALRGILNSGHHRSAAFVIRAVGENFEARRFSTWCPKSLAKIGRLPATLEDRAIEIRMRRKAPGEQVERLRANLIAQECGKLRRKCARFAADNIESLRSADPELPRGLNDRAADNYRPLFAIADVAGEKWPHRARMAALRLSGAASEADNSDAVQLLTDIRTIFKSSKKLSTSQILDELIDREDRPWAEWKRGRPMTPIQLARLLKPFEIKPHQIWVESRNSQGYLAEDFADAWLRYLPSFKSLDPLDSCIHAGLSPIRKTLGISKSRVSKKRFKPGNGRRSRGSRDLKRGGKLETASTEVCRFSEAGDDD